LEKEKALELALAQIEKQFGKGSIMRLGQAARQNVDVIPTGALPLDIALGVGGIPRGRVTEIYGPEASGKTTLGLQIIAEAQRMGGTAAFIDAEHAVDPQYAGNLGVDIDNLLIAQPGTGEEALEIRRVDTLKQGTAMVGNRTRVKVAKNKVAPPFQQAEFDIMFGKGISKAGAVLDMAVEAGIVGRIGAWFTYGNVRLGQGRENAKEYLEQNPDIAGEIEESVRASAGGLDTRLAGR